MNLRFKHLEEKKQTQENISNKKTASCLNSYECRETESGVCGIKVITVYNGLGEPNFKTERGCLCIAFRCYFLDRHETMSSSPNYN